jgi:hypothetical protein
MGKFIWQAWPGTNQTHFATKDIENLRQFIQTTRTQKSPERRQTRIAVRVKFRHGAIDPD